MQIRNTKVFYFEKYFENTIFILYFQNTHIRVFYFVFSKYLI